MKETLALVTLGVRFLFRQTRAIICILHYYRITVTIFAVGVLNAANQSPSSAPTDLSHGQQHSHKGDALTWGYIDAPGPCPRLLIVG